MLVSRHVLESGVLEWEGSKLYLRYMPEKPTFTSLRESAGNLHNLRLQGKEVWCTCAQVLTCKPNLNRERNADEQHHPKALFLEAAVGVHLA